LREDALISVLLSPLYRVKKYQGITNLFFKSNKNYQKLKQFPGFEQFIAEINKAYTGCKDCDSCHKEGAGH
jgi:hypothetical protein